MVGQGDDGCVIGPDVTVWFYPLSIGQKLTTNEWVEWRFHDFLNSRFLAYACLQGRRGDIGTAIILWSESYKQNPAGTLPDDDVQLAQLARYPSVEAWQAVREGVLYGWQPCLVQGRDGESHSGRLGHPVIAEIAADSWKRKAGKAAGREAANHSVQRTRVKKVLRELGRSRLADTDAVVDTVTAYLRDGSLYISKDNVTRALEEAAGVPRVVGGAQGRGS